MPGHETSLGSLTVNNEGSTTLESNDGSTTGIGSLNDDGIGAECPSLYESKTTAFGDSFEDVYYRTEIEHSKTVFRFVSKVFYMRFRDIHVIASDFSLTMNNDVIR